MKYLLAIIIAVVLVGCKAYEPPKEYNFEKTKTINKNYDAIWSELIAWFGSENIPIRTIDKASGIISTDYSLSPDKFAYYADCGSSGFMKEVMRDGLTANFNVVAAKVTDLETKVTINVFFNSKIKETIYSTRGKYEDVITDTKCNSRGLLEEKIFKKISQ